MFETAVPLPRKKHRFTVEFDVEVAPELTEKMRASLGQNLHSFLGYPMFAMGQACYSFNAPEPPKEIRVSVEQID